MKKFFVFNPKSYLTGQALYDLVKVADTIASQSSVEIFVTGPYADLSKMKEVSSHVVITAQHIDAIEKGRGMGAVLPESVYQAGARATFLNHAEKPISLAELVTAINFAKTIGMKTIVCASSIEEAKAIAELKPDIILCEPTQLIGTGQTSDESYILETNQVIKDISPSTRIMQAAGIMTPDDVYRVIRLGADGTGCTSGIVKADNPAEMLVEMVKAVESAAKEMN